MGPKTQSRCVVGSQHQVCLQILTFWWPATRRRKQRLRRQESSQFRFLMSHSSENYSRAERTRRSRMHNPESIISRAANLIASRGQPLNPPILGPRIHLRSTALFESRVTWTRVIQSLRTGSGGKSGVFLIPYGVRLTIRLPKSRARGFLQLCGRIKASGLLMKLSDSFAKLTRVRRLKLKRLLVAREGTRSLCPGEQCPHLVVRFCSATGPFKRRSCWQ
ncbi:MAG: hypothetical protein RL430_1660 [Actinomycetota bacterium]